MYTVASAGGDILYRESATAPISFGPARTLISSGGLEYNYATSSHQNYSDSVVVLATNLTASPFLAVGVLASDGAPTDQSAPFVVSINRHEPPAETTAATTLTYRVTFSKKVTGVDVSDFALTVLNGNVSGVLAPDAVAAVGSEGTTYDVTVSAVTGTGTLRLDLRTGGYSGGAYGLDSTDLADLVKSCTQCNGLLRNDIVLPIAFDPKASDCQPCAAVQTAFSDFAAKFPGLNETRENYTLLLTNFMNHRFGFSLSYSDYDAFRQNCMQSATATLCNKPRQEELEVDAKGSCMSDLFATALTNAFNAYTAYIDSVRLEFRNAYRTRCMNVAPALKMTADLYEYHYTLYYYDQAGSLVKTIPPEGVTLLNDQQLARVRLFRLLQSQGCYQYSDSVLFSGNGHVQFAAGTAYSGAPFTAETRLLLTSYAHQVLFSQVQETSTTDTQTPLVHSGYQVAVVGGQLQLSLYGYDQDSVVHQRSAVAVSVLPVQNILSLNQWHHLAVVMSGNPAAPWQLYVDGNPVTLRYTQNTLQASTNYAATSGLVVGANLDSHVGIQDKLRGSLKNLRLYSRMLSIGELRQNAYNNCQLPQNSASLVFWSPLNDATSNQVKELYSGGSGTLTGFSWQPFSGEFPYHRLATTYQYNSLGQVVEQYSPDGDTTYFWYDRLGRLIASQNKEQQTNPSYSGAANRFSYTRYDELGRIVEVGEKSGATDIRTLDLVDSTKIQQVRDWLTSATNRQVTKTLYDEPVSDIQQMGTSRKRVTASIYLEHALDAEGDSTLYGYDISGNVKTLVQHNKALVAQDAQNGKKRLDYDYDLVSGKVNKVSYQRGKGDQFFYRYTYDADNRLVRSVSSRDELLWAEEASYRYYLHGPLARVELGQFKVQGVDYAYTLQGWLKGINSDALDPSQDMAGDGRQGSMFGRVSRDVYAFKLGYFTGDYSPVGGSNAPAFAQRVYTAPSTLQATGNQLFNGNISYSTLALSKLSGGATAGYSYGYDQLNRLREMRQHTTTGAWSNSSIMEAYRESISYDANGNILKYLRKGTAATLDMDSLTYQYTKDTAGRLVNNRLTQVRDAVSAANYTVDIDHQSAGNYSYDRIGNLKKDVSEGITGIDWTVYGKIKTITKGAAPISYGYDAAGNRTYKEATTGGVVHKTFYVRDAQGSVLAVYLKKGSEPIRWQEQHLYGSSRLGVWRWDTIVPAAAPVVSGTYLKDSVLVGSRTYELSNHLGNVLATISDKKVGRDSSGVVNYYTPEVLSQTDYYPFGMQMPGRATASGSYRYGFNGKENDGEVKGEGNQQDYGFRIYDPRLGRFLSVDPITKDYPELTPYQFASNTPLWAIDIDGLEAGLYLGGINESTAEKLYSQAGEGVNKWLNSPTSASNKRALVEQYNGFYGTHLGVEDFNGLSNWEYWKRQIMFSGGQYGQNMPGKLRIPSTVQAPQTPKVIVQKSSSIPKLNTSTHQQSSAKTYVTTTAVHGGNTSAANIEATNPQQQITAKRTDPQVGFSSFGKEFRGTGYKLIEGRFMARDKGMSGKYDFVVTQEGRLLLGHGHYYLSKGAPSVQAAGVLEMYNGKIKTISNNSGHYQPNAQETSNFKFILSGLGVDVSGAKEKRVEFGN